MDKVEIFLKDAYVVYSHIDKPWKYNDGDTPRYSVSLLVNKGDDNYKAFLGGLKKVFEENKVAKAKMNKIAAQKIKDLPEAAHEYIDADEDTKMISLTTTKQPKLYRVEDEVLVKDKEAPIYPGATVSVKVTLKYIPKFGVMGSWPTKIVLIEESKTFANQSDDDLVAFVGAKGIAESTTDKKANENDLPLANKQNIETTIEESDFEF